MVDPFTNCTCPDDGVMRLADADRTDSTFHCMCHAVEVEAGDVVVRKNRHEKRKEAAIKRKGRYENKNRFRQQLLPHIHVSHH